MAFPRVKALYSYNARTDQELSFSADDIITIFDMTSEHWWEASVSGKRGYIPQAYVEHTPLPELEDAIDLSPAPPPPAEETVAPSSTGGHVSTSPSKLHAPPPPEARVSIVPDAPPPPPPPAAVSPQELLRGSSSQPDVYAELTKNITPLASQSERNARPVSMGLADEDEVEEIRPHAVASPNRPDLAKAIKIHNAKAKHKDLQPKGSNDLAQHLHRIKSKREEKEKQTDQNELAKVMRSQRDRMDSQAREQERFDKMSELEKTFARRSQLP
eukprot:m.67607 g.67607  ORF g.67607 m.67607 type:complete len:272 (+) comp7459_c0_seq3:162-977(+)